MDILLFPQSQARCPHRVKPARTRHTSPTATGQAQPPLPLRAGGSGRRRPGPEGEEMRPDKGQLTLLGSGTIIVRPVFWEARSRKLGPLLLACSPLLSAGRPGCGQALALIRPERGPAADAFFVLGCLLAFVLYPGRGRQFALSSGEVIVRTHGKIMQAGRAGIYRQAVRNHAVEFAER